MSVSGTTHTAVSRLRLRGLDGSNPLAFFAALGLLRVLDRRSRSGTGSPPKLSWEEGTWTPSLIDGPDEDESIQAILDDLRAWKQNPLLELSYDDDPSKNKPAKKIRDLKPPPDVVRRLLRKEIEQARRSRDRSALDALAGCLTDVALDNNGKIKPTAFHFTAGQQRFVEMAIQLRDEVTREDFRRALFEEWTRSSKLPSFSWDSTQDRSYALRASNPSSEKRTSEPGAEWLAFTALEAFPVFAHPSYRGARVETTAVRGHWKRATFHWPLWRTPLEWCEVRSLVQHGRLVPAPDGAPSAAALTPVERRNLGILVLFRSAITRHDQGGYGSFSPAEPV